MRRRIATMGTACLLAVAAACHAQPDAAAQSSAAASKPCRADVPADLSTAPARWLGDCRSGAAEGLGVTRAGGAAPYEFFAGRMRGGHLVDGVLVLKSGLMMVAVRFDPQRRVVVSDGLRPAEDEAVFRTAVAAANSVAQSFKAAGNRSSAAYYSALAEKIRKAPPE